MILKWMFEGVSSSKCKQCVYLAGDLLGYCSMMPGAQKRAGSELWCQEIARTMSGRLLDEGAHEWNDFISERDSENGKL
ncbi:hypothetical protein F511_18169 [Dorcoceras hygrometricum]|uniref:Uncharacterized protein n=1 Tax=Dorcoceras hygrometricum TaxID=472368 RepID=A0A2Z7BFE4_9LAMI|nr:hypothetical protein F511_18169 [Dorcoceras hygrometricum]